MRATLRPEVRTAREALAGLEDTLEMLRNPEEAAAVDEGIADADDGGLHDEDDVLADLRRRRDDT